MQLDDNLYILLKLLIAHINSTDHISCVSDLCYYVSYKLIISPIAKNVTVTSQ